jgi:tRNA (uracil-5-)-methyltransferase TRM9
MNQEKVWDEIAPLWNEYKTEAFGSRDNLIGKFIDESDRVLDLGCGSGRNFISKGRWIAVDFSKEMLKLAKKKAMELKMNILFVKSKCDNIPFDDNYFDKVLFIAALHCIEGEEERKNALKHVYRVLKPNGKAIITVWNKDSKRWRNKPKEKYVSWNLVGDKELNREGFDKVLRYYYLYHFDELISLLKEIGFKIIKASHGEARNVMIVVEK